MSGWLWVPSQVLTASATPLAGAAQRDRLELRLQDVRAQDRRHHVVLAGTTSELYAMPLTDSTSAQVTGITVHPGATATSTTSDNLWVNGAKSGYQITCH